MGDEGDGEDDEEMDERTIYMDTPMEMMGHWRCHGGRGKAGWNMRQRWSVSDLPFQTRPLTPPISRMRTEKG
jgi:hypothetical protein